MEMLRAGDSWRCRCYEVAFHEDGAAGGASEMDDVDRFIDRGSGCIARMNETEGFSVELLAKDVGADRAE